MENDVQTDFAFAETGTASLALGMYTKILQAALLQPSIKSLSKQLG